MTNLIIPPALASLVNEPTWIGYKKIPSVHTRRDGTVLNSSTKCPCDAGGRAIKSNDPRNLRTGAFFLADLGQAPYAGLAIACIGNTEGKRLIIDLDGCRDPATGIIAEWARGIIEACNTYTEISPSENGIHIIGGSGGWDTSKPNGRHIWTGPQRAAEGHKETGEIFFQTGFVTVTFNPLHGYEHRWSDIGVLAGSLDRRKGKGDVDTAFDSEAPAKPADPLAPIEVVCETLALIPNDRSVQTNWYDWDIVGMAVFCATEGSADGLAAWTAWSMQHPSYGATLVCEDRWEKWQTSSPPTNTGYGKIHYLAKKTMWENGFVWNGGHRWNDWNEQRKLAKNPNALRTIGGLLDIEVTLDGEDVARSSAPNPHTQMGALQSTEIALTNSAPTSTPAVNDNGEDGDDGPGSGSRSVTPWTPPVPPSSDNLPATAGDQPVTLPPSGGTVSRLPPNVATAIDALNTRPELIGLYGFDQMALCEMVMRPFPGTRPNTPFPRRFEDRDVVVLQDYLQRLGLVKMSKDACRDAIDRVAEQNPYHPVRDYLASLQWDGIHRVGEGDVAGGWMARYLGVTPTDYAKLTGQMFLVSLVARAYKPGCKVDYVPVWFGPQGARKSSACRALIGDEWFSDNLPHDIGGKDAKQHLRGKWLIEVAELSAFSKTDIERIKEFITRRDDVYRPSYGRKDITQPRQCVFVATTNDRTPFKDPTGNRRFWPQELGTIDIEGLARDRDMIMAEAVQMYEMGFKWWPDGQFENDIIKPEQDDRYDVDALEDSIATRLRLEQKAVTVMDVIKSITAGGIVDWLKIGTREQRRISGILTHLEWEMHRRGPNGERYWFPKDMAKWERAPGTFNDKPWSKEPAPDMSNVTLLTAIK